MGKRICAWCKADMGEAPDVEGDTHGICDECRNREMEKIEEEKAKNKKNKAT